MVSGTRELVRVQVFVCWMIFKEIFLGGLVTSCCWWCFDGISTHTQKDWYCCFLLQISYFFLFFCIFAIKNIKNSYFDQPLGFAAPKPWFWYKLENPELTHHIFNWKWFRKPGMKLPPPCMVGIACKKIWCKNLIFDFYWSWRMTWQLLKNFKIVFRSALKSGLVVCFVVIHILLLNRFCDHYQIYQKIIN